MSNTKKGQEDFNNFNNMFLPHTQTLFTPKVVTLAERFNRLLNVIRIIYSRHLHTADIT